MNNSKRHPKNQAVDIAGFASCLAEATYVIDFQKHCFSFVSDNDLFLCGHSREEVMETGYGFFKKTVHPDDQLLLLNIFSEIETYCAGNKKVDCYFTFNIRITVYPQYAKAPKYMLVYHRLQPVYEKGHIYGICTLACFVYKTEEMDNISGDLRLYRDNAFYRMSFENSSPEACEIQYLTEREKAILVLAMHGMSEKLISEELCITYTCLRQNVKRLCDKLGVKTMEQAILTAMNLRLVFHSKKQ